MFYKEYAAKLRRKNEEDLYIIKSVGEGATSFVYLAYNVDNKQYAVKLYLNKDSYSNEVNILNSLKPHKSIVKLLSYGTGALERGISEEAYQINHLFPNKTVIYAIFEYLSNFDLSHYVFSVSQKFPEKIAKKIFGEILDGVENLHKNGITHGDIKLENVMLSKNFTFKLIDFGFARSSKKGLISEITGTKYYSAPEVYMTATKAYDGEKNDIFALGVLSFVLVMRIFPFDRPLPSDAKYKYIIKGDMGKFWEKSNVESVKLSQEFKDLFSKMVKYHPKERLSLKEIKSHPWLSAESNNNSPIAPMKDQPKIDVMPRFHSCEFNKNKSEISFNKIEKKANLSQGVFYSKNKIDEDAQLDFLRVELRKRRDMIKQKLLEDE